MRLHRKGAILGAALCVALLLGLFTLPAAAVDPSQTTVTLRPSVTILVDGVERTFYDVTGKEVHTIYAHGTHYLPVRAIGELMGKNVNWDAATRTISLTSPRTAPATAGTPDASAVECQITVEVRPDITILVDGTQKTFQDAAGNPVYPMLNNGTTYLPVRAIGELMGKTVGWDAASKTITLTGGNGAPNVTDADTFQTTPTTPNTPTTPTTPTTPVNPSAPSGLIGEAKAKQLALALVSGATEQNITKFKLDRDDGIWLYEIEIFYNYTEYEIEIEGTTGQVLKMEQEYEGPKTNQTNYNHHSDSHHSSYAGHHHNSSCPADCPY